MQDIKPTTPPQKDYNFIWGRRTTTSILSRFFTVAFVLFIAINTFILITEGKTYFKQLSSLGKSGISSLIQAKETVTQANFEEAQQFFTEAEKSFSEFSQHSWFLSNQIFDPVLLAEAVNTLATSGIQLTNLGKTLKDIPLKILEQNKQFLETQTFPDHNLTQDLYNLTQDLQDIIKDLDFVYTTLAQVKLSLLPADVKTLYTASITQLEQLVVILNDLQSHLNITNDLLGYQVPHTYLILLQNNYEIRPAGGFIGSMVFAEINKGLLTKFDFKDIYDFDGIFTQNPDSIPLEYEDWNDKLWIRDANYTPDYTISAARVEQLLQKAKAPSFDTIVSIDQTFIESLLALTGPIPLAGYQGKITDKNYFTVLTYLVEANKGDNVDDKRILSKFMNQFQSEIFNISDYATLATTVLDNTSEKHIQLYSKKSSIQALFDTYNLSNRFFAPPPSHDLLLVTNTSIGGNKSDRFIKQRIIHNTHFNDNQNFTNTVTIRRYHSFQDSIEFTWQSQLSLFGVDVLEDFIRHILGRGKNISMLKVYIPNSATNIRLSGFDTSFSPRIAIDPDLQQKYVLFRSSVQPGEISEIRLQYDPQLNLNLNPVLEYNLDLVSQAGDTDTVFEKTYSFSPQSDLVFYRHVPDITSFTEQNNPHLEFNLIKNLNLTGIFAVN